MDGVDLAGISTEELEKELERRGKKVTPSICWKCNHWEMRYGFGGDSHFKNWICRGCGHSCKDCDC